MKRISSDVIGFASFVAQAISRGKSGLVSDSLRSPYIILSKHLQLGQ